MSTPQLVVERFSEVHFQAYQAWFDHAKIRAYLGYIDKEWLNHILEDQNGAEYAIIDEQGILQCVIGMVFPNEEDNYYVLTNIAVNPDNFAKGVGSEALKLVLNKYPLKASQCWLTYIDQSNTAAQQFFRKNNWTEQIKHNRQDDLLCFIYDIEVV